MPEIGSPTICKKLHSNSESKHIPIVVLTTQSNPESKASAKEHGIIAWITKIYKLKGLLVGIDKILARPDEGVSNLAIPDQTIPNKEGSLNQ
ncbi:MAG: two-component system chemotaxis response regulator CheY [Oleiphilaceae bacterium]|jgi:two-component system chemotaxis response regulator CheY